MRATLKYWLSRPETGNFIIAVIVVNAILLGLETYPAVMDRAGGLIVALDYLCLTIFVLEILAKLYADRLAFFRNPWNVFDFLIVAIALAPATHTLSVLRALRILRVLRVISVLPRLRRVIEGFLTALPGMASVFLLMGLVFYVGAVMSTKLFGASFPDWFGSLGASTYSLFQIMTLESWSMGIVRPVMEVYPQAWLFFVPFILLTTFAVMNLVVGLIVNSMQDAHHEEETAETGVYRDEVLGRLEKIEQLLARNEQEPADLPRRKAE